MEHSLWERKAVGPSPTTLIMRKAFKKIRELISLKAVHRKGFTIAEVRPVFILGQAMEEFRELLKAPDDPVEMADLLGVLFHYCIKQGWSEELIESYMLEKFALRFSIPKSST